MNICVTGGAGYIGSPLTERLLNLGHKVTVVDTFLHGYHGIMRLASRPLLKVINRDIRHEDRDYLEKQDVVFHLAALAGVRACESNKHWAREVNKEATAEIAKSLHRNALLIFASTTAIYGNRDGETATEELIPHSTNVTYPQTKLEAEKLLQDDDNMIILRLGTVYGLSPLMRPRSIVNDFVRMAVQEKKIVLYEDSTSRPYIHIEDCIDGLIFTMEHDRIMNGKCYDLGGVNFSKRGIVDAVQRQTECEIILSSNKSKFVQDFRVDSLKIRILGARFDRLLFDGISDLVKLYSFYQP